MDWIIECFLKLIRGLVITFLALAAFIIVLVWNDLYSW